MCVCTAKHSSLPISPPPHFPTPHRPHTSRTQRRSAPTCPTTGHAGRRTAAAPGSSASLR
eukprot:366264-Chlamydomonas_euryale.AAC.6